MPDERLDSMAQGIAPAPESAEALRASARRREDNLEHPLVMESAMGGTSDADRPADEAAYEASLRAGARDTPGSEADSSDSRGHGSGEARGDDRT
ncbi:MAG TPA: hypothetical protein VGO40_09130 [Longimicrobium sp.]|jgi:hypothetical protein|nr:hypothetical protein [Longimicrobium sp.]